MSSRQQRPIKGVNQNRLSHNDAGVQCLLSPVFQCRATGIESTLLLLCQLLVHSLIENRVRGRLVNVERLTKQGRHGLQAAFDVGELSHVHGFVLLVLEASFLPPDSGTPTWVIAGKFCRFQDERVLAIAFIDVRQSEAPSFLAHFSKINEKLVNVNLIA